MSRVLVLGHSGFIGGHIVRHLQQVAPQLEIVGQSKPPLDLTDQEQTDSLIDELGRGTAVIMCAAIKRQLGDSLDTFDQNVRMVTNLCRVLSRAAVDRLIYFSSAAVYGEETENTAISEGTAVNPTSYYGIAKFASERLLLNAFGNRAGLVLLRPPLIYGPGDQALYGPSGFVRAAVKGERLYTWGDGSEQREFVYVEDVADIVSRLLFIDFSGVLNLAGGNAHTFRDAIDCLARQLPNAPEAETRARSKTKVDNRYVGERLRSLFPEVRFTSLDDGIRKTLEWEQTPRAVR